MQAEQIFSLLSSTQTLSQTFGKLNADETLSNEECQVMLEQHIMKAEKDSIDIIDHNMAGFDTWMNRVSFHSMSWIDIS